MLKRPFAGKDHCDAGLIGGCDYLVILLRAARSHDSERGKQYFPLRFFFVSA
jgi:hypothetical protein